jgi:hypothetical protein
MPAPNGSSHTRYIQIHSIAAAAISNTMKTEATQGQQAILDGFWGQKQFHT